MSRVKVVEPGTGIEFEVESTSPLVERWKPKPAPKAVKSAEKE